MNNLMSRKKKYRFQVELRVEELQHVPFLCQELYVKVRLLNGGFTSHSQSLMVQNHAVHWDETFKFCSKMTANASTGELDSCVCRVSVRQEMRGGRSFQKLGYADVNLAQFAGSGGTNCYLLEAYDSKHRLHNSTLRVTVNMTLLSGDPCFKAQPWPRPLQPPIIEGPSEVITSSHNQPISVSEGSLPSLGYNSLDKKMKGAEEQEAEQNEQAGHSRNSSNTSGSGYVSNASQSDKSNHAREMELPSDGLLFIAKVRSLFKSLDRCNRDNSICSSSSSSSNIYNPNSTPVKILPAAACFVCHENSVTAIDTMNAVTAIDTMNDFSSFHLSDSFYNGTIFEHSRFDVSSVYSSSSNSALSITRSGSQGSGGTYSEGGSLERAVTTGRGKSSIHSDNIKDPRVVSTREDAHDMIDQIFQDTIGQIKPDEAAETSGLQLVIREDGTASISGQTIRSNGDFSSIIINKR